MSKAKQRVLFAAMILLGLGSPLIAILPFVLLPEATPDSLPEAYVIALFLFALLTPFVFLYFAARAAVRGEIPGVLVLGSWWLVGALAAFTAQGPGQPANSVIKAVTLGVIAPSSDGLWSLPGLVLTLGAARNFSLEMPLYLLFLMAAYTGIKQHQLKAVKAAEHSRLYSAWDETGERVDAAGNNGE